MLLFSSPEQKKQIQSSIKSALTLTADETKELAEIDSKINPANNPKDYAKERRVFSRLKLADNIKGVSLDKIYKYMQASPLFKEMVLDDKLPHVDAWRKSLKVKEHLYFRIDSLDGEHSISVNNLYLGEYCMYKHDEAERAIPKNGYVSAYWLDQACQIGSFYALAEELKEDIQIIKQNELPEQMIIIEKELERLADLYGTMGSFHAAMTYLDLARTFGSETLQEKAAEHFLMGKEILAHNEISQTQEVLNVVTKSRDSGLAKFGFDSWEAAGKSFLEPLTEQKVAVLQQQAKQTVDEKILHRIEKFAKSR